MLLPTAPDNLYEVDAGRFFQVSCSSSLPNSTVTWKSKTLSFLIEILDSLLPSKSFPPSLPLSLPPSLPLFLPPSHYFSSSSNDLLHKVIFLFLCNITGTTQYGQWNLSGSPFVTLTFLTLTGGIQPQDAGTYECLSESVDGSTTNITIQIEVLGKWPSPHLYLFIHLLFVCFWMQL